MISCTEFILAYSELFKFLDARGGQAQVEKFWQWLSDSFLGNLRQAAQGDGLAGCYAYWSHTLNEEAADFTMTLDEDAGTFSIEMHRCPSKGMLLANPQVQPYPDYCQHCDTLYRRVLEPLGFDYQIDLSQAAQARCKIVVSKPKSSSL